MAKAEPVLFLSRKVYSHKVDCGGCYCLRLEWGVPGQRAGKPTRMVSEVRFDADQLEPALDEAARLEPGEGPIAVRIVKA